VPQLIDYEIFKLNNEKVVFNVFILFATNVLLKGEFISTDRPERCSTNYLYKVGNHCINQHVPDSGETSVVEVANNVVNCLDNTGWNGQYYYTSLERSSTSFLPKTAFYGHQSSDGSLIYTGGLAFKDYLNEDICAYLTSDNVFCPDWWCLLNGGGTYAKVSSNTYDEDGFTTWSVNYAYVGHTVSY